MFRNFFCKYHFLQIADIFFQKLYTNFFGNRVLKHRSKSYWLLRLKACLAWDAITKIVQRPEITAQLFVI